MSPTAVRRACLLGALSLLQTATPLRAQEPGDPGRLRVHASCRPTVVSDAAERSATVRALVVRLERSDLIVYVRCAARRSPAYAARLGLLGAARAVRVVLIELGAGLPWSEQAALVGHELQHAIEIADAPWVRDARTMAALYRQVGMEAPGAPGVFETRAAIEAGDRTRREWFERAGDRPARQRRLR